MMPATPVLLVGGGGHAADVLSAIEARNAADPGTFNVIGYVDDQELTNHRLERRGVTYLGVIGAEVTTDCMAVISIGDPRTRADVARRLTGRLELAPPIVHPSAVVADPVRLGWGVVVLAQASISSEASVDANVHVCQSAVVGHDSAIGSDTSVFPSAVLGGEVQVGSSVLVGSNATVLQGLRIGDRSTVGAGAVANRDVPAGVTAIGAPARW